ncbi:CHAP domain-containing protein [Weissella paramesenteroides]|uniref:COG3942 and LysM peptidoglycan-binding domain-containing protein n=1 Tax=Weissella paramesenteroides TaxID=1249 RepID=UPI003F7488D1
MTSNVQRSNKGWLLAAATAAAAAILPMTQTTTASADETKDSNDSHASWRAKTVEDVKSVLLTAGKEYTVQSGDTLSTIAAATDLSVDEIASANGVSDVNTIHVGEVLKLDASATTTNDKAATNNTNSQTQDVEKTATTTTAQATTTEVATPAAPTYSTAGNSYPAGQCTWFVKNALSWVGNNWGNASSWGASAAAAGRVVNGQPSVGSVVVFGAGVQGAGALGHVAVVDSVNGNSITISEGNYAGMAYHTRTISASGLTFIH